jgi:hypothetical protein
MLNYVKMTASSNFSNVLSVLIVSGGSEELSGLSDPS